MSGSGPDMCLGFIKPNEIREFCETTSADLRKRLNATVDESRQHQPGVVAKIDRAIRGHIAKFPYATEIRFSVGELMSGKDWSTYITAFSALQATTQNFVGTGITDIGTCAGIAVYELTYTVEFFSWFFEQIIADLRSAGYKVTRTTTNGCNRDSTIEYTLAFTLSW